MERRDNRGIVLSCSFCSRPQKEVEKLLAGVEGHHIYDECIELCSDIIRTERREAFKTSSDDVAAYREMVQGLMK